MLLSSFRDLQQAYVVPYLLEILQTSLEEFYICIYILVVRVASVERLSLCIEQYVEWLSVCAELRTPRSGQLFVAHEVPQGNFFYFPRKISERRTEMEAETVVMQRLGTVSVLTQRCGK